MTLQASYVYHTATSSAAHRCSHHRRYIDQLALLLLKLVYFARLWLERVLRIACFDRLPIAILLGTLSERAPDAMVFSRDDRVLAIPLLMTSTGLPLYLL
jgi:hypothetical protein